MLILDGHSSHYTLELVKTAAAENVILFCLPPHTTADSQPLDTSCFGPLKKYWNEVCRQYLFDHPGQVVTKFQFSTLFADAWSKGMTIANVTSGFRGTGIYPFSPSMILDKFLAESNSSSQPSNDHVVATVDSQSGLVQTDSTRYIVEADLTPEMIKLYERRVESGYDIYTDANYVAWLEKFHPEHVPPLSKLYIFKHFLPTLIFVNCRCDITTE